MTDNEERIKKMGRTLPRDLEYKKIQTGNVDWVEQLELEISTDPPAVEMLAQGFANNEELSPENWNGKNTKKKVLK